MCAYTGANGGGGFLWGASFHGVGVGRRGTFMGLSTLSGGEGGGGVSKTSVA